MSIAEFSVALQEQAYKKWFKSSSKSILIDAVRVFRNDEQSAKKTSFTISDATIQGVAEYLSDGSITQEQIDSIKEKMISFMGKGRSFDIAPNGELYFPRVSFGTIDSILKAGFKDLLDKAGSRKISDIMEKGHVYGIATNLLSQTMNNLQRSNVPEKAKTVLLEALTKFEQELIRQDEETTNFKDPKYYLYAKYKKNPRKYLVELQLKESNQASGTDVRLLTNQLRRYFSPENFVALNKNLLKEPDDAFIHKLLNSKGSPSYMDLIVKELVDTIKGKKPSQQEYAVPTTLISEHSLKIDKSKLKASIKKDLEDIRVLKDKIKTQLRTKQGHFTSLASLQTLLNQALSEQIRKNMGTGNETRILNYRTGRFASSAKVEKLSQSREGMITAFYNYMKYPYQTFEPGFRQGSPASRDPKLLISKSIREIGVSLVKNRMRAVCL